MLVWLRKNMKTIMMVVAVLFFASMFYGLGYRGWRGEWGGKKALILAKVNGRVIDNIRYQEFVNRVLRSMGKDISLQDMAFIENLALMQAIDFAFLLGEAKKKVKVSGREVDGAIESIMKQQNIPSKRELENALKRIGLNSSKFRELVKEDMLVQKLQMKLREEVRITPDDLKEVRASHILLTNEAEAKEILSKIKKGEDFANLAKKYSKDPGSSTRGGDLGYFHLGMMVEPFEKAAFSLKVGEVSGVVKSPFGYHIIKLTDSRLRKFPGGEEPEKAALKEKQENTFRRWYSEARSKIKVEIIDPRFRGHELRFKGRIQEAIAEYKKAVGQNPTDALLHVFLGDLYSTLRQDELAVAEYENAVRIDGGNPYLYLILGKAYEKKGQSTLAAEQYRKASLIAGDNKELHEKLLKIFQELKKPNEIAREREELKRIEKKEKFEKELKGEK